MGQRQVDLLASGTSMSVPALLVITGLVLYLSQRKSSPHQDTLECRGRCAVKEVMAYIIRLFALCFALLD